MSHGIGMPLYIVDGKEATSAILSALKPESISSMEVLKDKSATERYGEKGKYGVILINLKKGDAPFVVGVPSEKWSFQEQERFI